MSDIDETTSDIDYEYTDDDITDIDWDLEPESDEPPHNPEPEATTHHREEYEAVLAVVDCMNQHGLKLDTFVYALCYGNPLCTAESDAKDAKRPLKNARRELMKSPLLPKILNNLHTPPHYTGTRPKAASEALDRWAWSHVVRLSRAELDQLAASERKEELEAESETERLTDFEGLRFSNLVEKTTQFTPNLVRFLTAVGETKPNARNRRREDPDMSLGSVQPSFAAVMSVHSLAFQMAPRCNLLQKQLSLYFRSKHAPKSLFALFNECGYITSYSWSSKAIKSLSKAQTEKMKKAILEHASFWSYDNLRLSEPIKAQRGDRHTTTDNGTAMTVIQLPDAVKEIFMKTIEEPALNMANNPEALVDTNSEPTEAGSNESPTSTQDEIQVDSPPTAEHGNPPIASPTTESPHVTWDDFADFDRYIRIARYNKFLILEILFDTVPGLSDLEIRTSEKLSAPPPVHIMPSGKEHRTRYFMLGTVPIDESSVGGNLQAIEEILRQTGMDSEEIQKLLGSGLRYIPIVGDQMTTSRIRTVRNLRVRDSNGYERLTWAIVVPGWFHILLNLGMSTFDSHRGGDKTNSFIRDVTLLGRTGLTMNMRQKRPNFFTNDEFLRHKLFALIRSLWMSYSTTDTVEKLVEWVKASPEDTLSEVAQRILDERISSEALNTLSCEPAEDEVLRNTILQTRDLLQYYSVRRAIQTGNVGWLEDLIPNLIIYFKGRENFNYAQELAEYMQWMRYDAPPGMSDAVRDHVWLVNTSGRKDGFYETDRLQEFNNGKQKKFGPPPQTTSWEAHKEIAPAIPILGELAEKTEDLLFNFRRTRVHKDVDAELDISRLASRHISSNLHTYEQDRQLADKSDISKDYVQLGVQSLQNTDWLAKLHQNRMKFRKLQVNTQIYDTGEEKQSQEDNTHNIDNLNLEPGENESD
ncbi:Callose synthase 2 [Rhizoctonia solani]|uniref:Callose synthase 2 n=1 Tax=Rhizoctonia solani TaxID=456999 RepID=A0A0K6FQM7_9AGAM|nr:Callose synthase 2 [Rhizoctonia solani]